jgi:dTDP-4-dehydrorhamnose 3,5-epimerase
MALEFMKTSLPDIIMVNPGIYKDPRGFLMEIFHQEKYAENGIHQAFVQDNYSHSKKDTIRGLHYQLKNPQGKLVCVIAGEIFDVVVDIRRGSPTFEQWLGVILSAENRHQIYIPEGFAHGFCVMSETADVIYKCTDFYKPDDNFGILWSDRSLGINWPVKEPILSEKDIQSPGLDEIPEERLPVYKP